MSKTGDAGKPQRFADTESSRDDAFDSDQEALRYELGLFREPAFWGRVKRGELSVMARFGENQKAKKLLNLYEMQDVVGGTPSYIEVRNEKGDVVFMEDFAAMEDIAERTYGHSVIRPTEQGFGDN